MSRTRSRPARFKVGVTDGALKLAGQPEALLLAGELRFDCLQVSLGRYPKDGKLALSEPSLQQTYLSESRRHKCPIVSLYLDILNVNGLKWREDPLGPRWLAESVAVAKALRVPVVQLPFFGKQRIESEADLEYVGDVLREIAPAAERARVSLGLEDTLSARDNVRLLERVRSRAVRISYDVGNAARAGFDVVEEIRWLGRARICEVQVKDNPGYLGEGGIDFNSVVAALADIGYSQPVLLDTESPTGDVEVDLTRNQAYVRRLIQQRNGTASSGVRQ